MNIEFFRWTWTAIGELVFIIVVWFTLVYSNRGPSIGTIRQFVDMLSDRGGVIALLAMMSIYFFVSSMRFFYLAIMLTVQQKLDPQNAIVLMGVQFVTGTAFGGSFGAMLKTMNGNVPPPTTTASVSTMTQVSQVVDTNKPDSKNSTPEEATP